MNLKSTSRFLILSCVAAMTLPIAAAQVPDSTTQSTEDHSQSANVRTVTGCLSQGSDEKSFNLLADDGGTWVLQSKAVALSDHVGQTITVTGKVWRTKAKTKAVADPVDAQHGRLTVASVNIVSDSCKK
jgi:hypothetical protein